MALTITQRLRMSLGGKAFRTYEITHDESVTDITAASLDLHYVDHAIVGINTPTSSKAQADLTTSYGETLVMTAMSTGAITNLWVIGH